jgi:hypothetical protein
MAKGAGTEAPFVVQVKGIPGTYGECKQKRENKGILR